MLPAQPFAVQEVRAGQRLGSAHVDARQSFDRFFVEPLSGNAVGKHRRRARMGAECPVRAGSTRNFSELGEPTCCALRLTAAHGGLPIGVTAVAMPAITALPSLLNHAPIALRPALVAMSHAPRQRVGLASGVFNASRQTGGALGVALLGALLTGSNGDLVLGAAFLAAAVVYAGGIALALTGWRRTRRII